MPRFAWVLLQCVIATWISLGAASAGQSGQRGKADGPRVYSHPVDGRPTLAPFAFVRFCLQHPADCTTQHPGTVKLTQKRIMELEGVNASVNKAISPTVKPKASTGETWAIAPAQGDCNDYAVTKRHELIRRGWPSSALLLTAVRIPSGEGHLVLVVASRDGDYVLDNLTSAIRHWSSTGYEALKRQSSINPKLWVSLSTGQPG